MPGEGGRRGRRDNGLDAVAFVPLLDVDPRVGEHLLDVLGSAGVPAYLEPSVDVEPYTRALSLPSPPTDRLWVDRDQRREAREIVDAETPHGTRPQPQPRDDEPSHGLADLDEERAWQAIVAGFSAPADPAQLPGPAHRREDPPPEDPAEPGPDPGPAGEGEVLEGGRAYRDRDDLVELDPWSDSEGERGRRRRTRRGGPADTDPLPSGADLDASADARARYEADAAAAADDLWLEGPPTLDDDNDEHYEPPPPPPVPRPSRHTVLAAVLVTLGILLLAVPGLVGLDDRSGLTFGVMSILGGGALLVLRLRETRSDDGPDDGAIV